ncbi:MAG: metallophosphoesterase, partial [Acidobacteria bacterium]|nr:metallophosphoesterase [Acidobacteriota bacterium]
MSGCRERHTPALRRGSGTVLGFRDIELPGADPGVGSLREAGAALTAALVDNIPGTVFLAGDLAYPHGSEDNFSRCFEPTWGRFRSRWRPSPGNHEYETPGAEAYFRYFGEAAGPGRLGYYSFRAGNWLVLMLNSNVSMARSSPQYLFIDETLANEHRPCTLAVWHHPLFSSGPNGENPFVREVWRELYQERVDVIVNG